jgi:hypothetical protein
MSFWREHLGLFGRQLLDASKLRLQPTVLPLNSAAVRLIGRLIPLIGRQIRLFGSVGNFASDLMESIT